MFGLFDKLSDDEKLVKACLKGDAAAERELFKRFSPAMLAVCKRYVSDRDEAEDVLQESFIKVFEKLESYKGNGSLQGWIRRITVNTSIDFYNKKSKMRAVIDYNVDDVSNLSLDEGEDLEGVEFTLEELYGFIYRLPERYRMAFNMYAIDGYSHAEIAASLSFTEGASKSIVSRARTMLKEMIKETLNKRKYAEG